MAKATNSSDIVNSLKTILPSLTGKTRKECEEIYGYCICPNFQGDVTKAEDLATGCALRLMGIISNKSMGLRKKIWDSSTKYEKQLIIHLANHWNDARN